MKIRIEYQQGWLCEKCDAIGEVPVCNGDDTMSIVVKFQQDHKSKSPDCDQPFDKLRVLNGEGVAI